MYLLKLWFSLFVVGLVFYPMVSLIFKKFHDKGWIFSKLIGICISSWFMWIISYLKILKYTRASSYIVIGVFAIINGLILFIRYKKKKLSFKDIDFKLIRNILITEIVFILCLCFWCYIKGFDPAISNVTEQFMDYGYMNSIMQTDYMPPEDIWLSGNSINYYYFGQYISGFICKISGLSASEGYNIIITLIATCTFILPASIGYNLFNDRLSNKKNLKIVKTLPIIVAIFIGIAASLAGTLHYPIYRWFDKDKTNYSYIDETRYIGYKPEVPDKTATEVPLYSSLVGDLHAHYIDLVFSLVTIALLAQFFINKTDEDDKEQKCKFKNPWYYIHLLLIALMLGIQKMTNYWDYPIYIVIISATIITKELICGKFNKKSIIFTLLSLVGIIAVEELITLPFTLDLMINSTKVCFTGIMSPFYKLLVKWGLPTLCAIGFLVIYLIRFKNSHEKFKQYLNNNLSDLFVIIIGICAFGLVLLPEIVYLKDIYGDDYKRFNTMFKLTYQAFLLFSISTNYILFRLLSSHKKYIAYTSLALLVINTTTFGYGIDTMISCYSRAEHKGVSAYTTESYIKNEIPEDYKAIQWIRSNIDRDKVFIEACKVGNSYSTSSRISTFTGNPTVLGWMYHEWIWRSNEDYSIPQELNTRNDDIRKFYRTSDYLTAKQILTKYDVDYIYIGKIEYETYQVIDVDLLKSLGEVVYNDANNYIIKVDK